MEKRIADLNKEQFDYIDNEMFVLSHTDRIPEQLVNELLDMEVLIQCWRGKASFKLEQLPVAVEAGQCVICTDYQPIHDLMVSPDLELSIIGFSWHLLEDVPALAQEGWTITNAVRSHPVFTPSDDERQRLGHYTSLMKHHVQNQGSKFSKDMLHLLCQSFVFELIDIAYTRDATPIDTATDTTAPQSLVMSRQFFEILARGEGTIRSVAQVADLMHVTPKYLSHVISKVSGHPPIYHIHQYTIRAIERQLRYSDKTIKEISASMGFPSLAFFGKFVKQHLGLSPKTYRTTLPTKQ